MKRTCKLLSILCVLAIFLSGCSKFIGSGAVIYTNPTEYQGVVFENGGMTSEVGINNRPRMDVVRTKEFLKIEDFERVEIGSGYHMIFVFYSDKDFTQRVTSSGWTGDGKSYSFEDMARFEDIAVYPSGYEPVSFRVVVANNNDTDIAQIPADAFKITKTDGSTVSPKMTEGTIDRGAVHPAVTTRLYTEDLYSFEDYKSVSLSADYKAIYHIYNADGLWLGSLGGWQQGKDGDLFTTEQMKNTDSLTNYISGEKPVYFKFQIKSATTEGASVPVTSLEEIGLNIVLSDKADAKNLNYPENEKKSDFTFENQFHIGASSKGPWQEGAIWDGKLFVIDHAGYGSVHSLKKQELVGEFTLDKIMAISPHANSVCFGTEYYEDGDKYPLMYVSVYNNYANARERYEGHCLVYRLIENKQGFKTELVQVIKIGFVEDLSLWKSLEGRGDVNPYGNFVIDTDNNDFYAYVLRDADKVTRFFKFDIPTLDMGEYNFMYGCNVVTLEPSDIKDQFDIDHFAYIQGSCYFDGKIISAGGLGHKHEGDAKIKIIDLKTKKEIVSYETATAGSYNEPETVAVDREKGEVYFAGSDGLLRKLTCIK